MDRSLAFPSLRIGLIGLQRFALFHLERWSVDPRIEVTAVCESDAAKRELASGYCSDVLSNPNEILAKPKLNAILVDVPTPLRSRVGTQVLAAGKDLMIEPPIGETLTDGQRLLATVKESGQRLFLWTPWREEADFRAALMAVQSGELGGLRVLRHERWEAMAARVDPANLSKLIVPILDQLVTLTDLPARQVLATSLAECGLTVTVRFTGGAVGLLTLHAAASARIEHGWAIDAERGGYAAGRRWVRTAEGEIYDMAITPQSALMLDDQLLRQDKGPSVEDRQSLRLIALLAAVEQSLQSGGIAEVEPTD